jgi:cell division protein FtsB/DNA-binding CsgD family transcriptional regulator
VVALAGIISSSAASSVDFSRLDSLIAEQSHIIDRKEAHLSQLKERLSQESAPADRYGTIKQLYEEYAAYQYDSAYAYVSQCLALARQMSDDRLLNESRLDLAHILSTACLMDQARLLLGQIDTTRLSATQLIRYYRTRTDLLIYQAEYMQGTQYAAEAVQQLIDLRRRTAALNVPHDDVNYLLTLAECRADSGQSRQAISLLEGLMQHYHIGERLYSIITSTMSFHYGQLGDKEKQMQYLVKSAESDLEGCIRENTSLRAIADILFDEGDIDRAYRYMRVAVDDANFYGTRLRNIQSSRIVPKILDAYQTKQERNHRNMMWLLGIISVIALLLVGGVIAIYQLLKRYRRLNEQKKAINEQLSQVNAQLGDTVEQLHESNVMLREREKLKEEYIARFLTLSSRFVDRGEEQRKALYRLYRDRKTEDLVRELKSTHFGAENAKLFYENFDHAFLNIYPNFVDEVNKLLQDDGKIEVKQGKRLTTESRVLALIRIGITDNQSIAAILRASLTTIYTYRSKLKARAINKDDFEAQVKAIEG